MRKNLSANSVLCISIAQKPGMFGTIIHNAGFDALGINFFYRAFAINDLKGAISGVRSFGIRGCSVSMPFKEDVIQYLDSLDPLAKKARAVNTIVNTDGKLVGFNTDIIGVEKCLKKVVRNKKQKILVLGAGGMTRATLVALDNLRLKNVCVTNRTKTKLKKISDEFDIDTISWLKKEKIEADLIINTTSIGMFPEISHSPLSNDFIKNSRIVMDAVSNPSQTKLIQLGKKNKKIVIDGLNLAFQQALIQFKLYTGKNPPVKEMQNAINRLVK